MKSRISFFNKTVFRKNLTRFAPAWGLCTVFLTLAVFTCCSFNLEQAGSNLLDLGQSYCTYSFFFAPLCAQLLFGDLFNSRMCNALHALPLRRETWFGTNVLSGFVFHLIPAVSATVLAGLLLILFDYQGNLAVVPLFLLCVLLQYLFFFGIAVFSVFCVGSRFGHTVVYLLLNFGSLIVQWLVSSLYTPMFYGLKTNPDPFQLFSPVVKLSGSPFFTVETIQRYLSDQDWDYRFVDTKTILPGEGFVYYFLAAAAGVLLLVGALWLYRRRKLEYAGDFLAIPGLGSVFSLIFTLTVGAFFFEISAGILLLLGLVVGWFTSRMMLERTVRVFKKKNFLRCGAVIGVFLLTMGLAALDPLGLESWVPEEEETESVSLFAGHYDYRTGDPFLVLEEEADVEAVIGIHRDCLDYYYENADELDRIALRGGVPLDKESIPLTLSYRLKNGRTVNRHYYVRGEENLQQLVLWLNAPEMVFGEALTEETFLEQNLYVEWHKANSLEKKTVFGPENLQELYRAILADCANGTMQQELEHYTSMDLERSYTLTFSSGLKLTVYTESTNTIQWIKNHR